MKTSTVLAIAGILASSALSLTAGTTVYSWSGSQVIPDNNANGVAYSFYINTPTAELISSVSVQLNIAGGWNGDLYSYLSHGNGFAVLLNRAGRTAANPGGSSASGMNVVLSDSGGTDIHSYSGGTVNGSFAPDGRNVSPYAVVDTNPRTAMLGSFNGLTTGGFWTLYFADVSPLATSTLQGWTVTINTAPVPEPGTMALIGLSTAWLLVCRRARNPKQPNPRNRNS